MGQIIGGAAKPKRCNLNKLSQLGTPAAGEYILVSSDNSMNAAGQGNFDCYIVGDETTAATALPLIKTYNNDADDEPTAGSNKLVKSGGVAEQYNKISLIVNGISALKSYNGYIDIGTNNRIINSGSSTYIVLPVNGGDILKLQASNVAYPKCRILICKDFVFNHSLPYPVNGILATMTVPAQYVTTTELIITLPSDAKYVVITKTYSDGSDILPIKLLLNDIDILNGFKKDVNDLKDNTLKIVEQELSGEQKEQVKNNIGITVDTTPIKDSTSLIESGAVYPIKEKLDTVVDDETETLNTTIERTSYDSTYELGYIGASVIGVSYSAAYMTYKTTVPYSGYMYIDPNNYGNVGNIFRIGIERTSHTVWENYYGDVNSMPKADTKLQLIEGDILYVTIAAGSNTTFILQYEYSYSEYYLKNIKFSEAQKNEIALISQKIKIHYVSATKFEVTVPQIGNNAEIVHNFLKQHNENDVTFGSTTVHLVTADIWYPHQILINGQNAIQGNLNFIYRLSSEGAHVGPGHGCEVSLFTKFFADGVEFDPSNSFDDIYCDVFRVILKSNMYATSSPSTGTNAIPVLDENGEPVVTAVHTLNATYRVNNIIDWENNLLIKRDNIKFLQLHAGMVQGQASMFNTFTICDSQYDTNKFTWNTNQFDIELIDGSVNLKQNIHQLSSGVIMYGKGIIIKQTLERLGIVLDENNYNANYCSCVFYEEAHDPRLKVYMQPSKTDMVDGTTARETFNDGDVIRCRLKREIEVNI